MPAQLAPEGNMGPTQIIPTRGPHEQIYVDQPMVRVLLMLELVQHEPEYGPNANVYRPKKPADAEKIKSWLG